MKTFKHLILTQQGDKFWTVANEKTKPEKLDGYTDNDGLYVSAININRQRLDEWLQSCQTFEVDHYELMKAFKSLNRLVTSKELQNGLDCSTFLALNDYGKMVFYTGEDEAVKDKPLLDLMHDMANTSTELDTRITQMSKWMKDNAKELNEAKIQCSVPYVILEYLKTIHKKQKSIMDEYYLTRSNPKN